MNILSTIHSKYQGETMFCFVCVATVFGYILGVNRVIDAIILKHSDETRVKIVKTLNKYSQTNLRDLAEMLASNNLILSLSSNDQFDNSDVENNNNNDGTNDDGTNDDGTNDDGTNDDGTNDDDTNDDGTNETSANVNYDDSHRDKQDQEKKEDKEDKEKQIQETTIMSPSSTSSVSTSEEDYELVRKNENVNHLKNKNNMKYFEWLNIF
jgi:hypothetical protein